MSTTTQVLVPDIGDFTDVPVIEVLVAVGDEVVPEQSLVVLESDKATMEVPSSHGGTVEEVHVAVGDAVSEGTPVVTLSLAGEEGGEPAPAPTPTTTAATPPRLPDEVDAELVVVGSGPGGYAAAFRAADLGMQVTLVERHASLGGVCLNVGCIPSKALLHAAKTITEAEAMGAAGIAFGAPQVDLDALRAWKDGVVAKLTGGLAQMAKARKVTVVRGRATFTGPHELSIEGDDGATSTLSFGKAIVAAGSEVVRLPGFPDDDPRVMDSTGAQAIPEVPERLLVVGGGIIGLEMATVYDALGSAVTVVELADQLIPGCDPDLVEPLRKRIEGRYEAIKLETKVEALEARDDGLHATFSDGTSERYDRVLVAVGRKPNGRALGLEAAGVEVDELGFVPHDDHMRTNVEHVYVIGDVAGGPMLAHKAAHEGHIAAENAAGHDAVWDKMGIPSVAYTEPEVAWVGLTETEAQRDGVEVETAVFPWAASGRALAVEGASGRTKLVLDPSTRRVLGAGIVGPTAGELIAEVGLALEMGATTEDLAATIHAHPTLSETIGLAGELAEGTVTDLPPKRRR